jgi:hypothetical protein
MPSSLLQQLGTSSADTPSLPTSRQQVVLALFVPSMEQLVNSCELYIIRLVARLFQNDRCSHDTTILLRPCVVNLVTRNLVVSWLYQICKNTLVTSLMSSSLLQVVNNSFQTCYNNWEHCRLRASTTRVKISHLSIASLRQQCVNRLCLHCLSQVINKFGTSC